MEDIPNHFELLATDDNARTGRLTTPHGVVRTPAFMPVGTAGAMKGVHWRDVRDAGTDIVLGNTYHLMLRPGAERIAVNCQQLEMIGKILHARAYRVTGAPFATSLSVRPGPKVIDADACSPYIPRP